MKTLYIDCSSGASGDMMLGALIDLGVPEKELIDGLSLLGLDGFQLEIRKKLKNGAYVTDVDVVTGDDESVHPYSGQYRNYKDIRQIIDNSKLDEKVKKISKKIFHIKAQAESEAHNVHIDHVQFHEAGAIDSIVDIVGTAICYSHLNVGCVISKDVPTGYGTITCACGHLPVPAPAVKSILAREKIPNYRSNVKQELLTPTGAAILAGIVDEFVNSLDIPKTARRGYGIGKRDTGLEPLKMYCHG